jgi:hypothetical protein
MVTVIVRIRASSSLHRNFTGLPYVIAFSDAFTTSPFPRRPRMSRLMSAAFLTAILCTPEPLFAQANPLVGKWRIEYERGRRIENGAPTSIMGTGTIAIVTRGDSLVATLESGPRPDGSPTPPATFSGRSTTDGTVFVQKANVQVNQNGEVRSVEITLTWTLNASGDALTGTLLRTMPMLPEGQSPTPVTGTRVAGS